MAYTTVSNQILISQGVPVDAKLTPVQDFSALTSYEFYSNAYNGLEVMVFNGGYPVRMMLVFDEGTTPKKYNWQITHTITSLDYASLVSESGFVHTIVDTLSTKKNVSRAFTIGQKAIVLSDETREGKWSEYIVTEVSNGYPTWEYNHADPEKFSIVANSADTSIEIYYDNIKIGESASLEEILREWQLDNYISSGSVIEESGETFIELTYNDVTLPPVRINVSNIGGSQYTAGYGISISGDVISVVKSDMMDIAISAVTEALIPESAKEALDTLEEISEWIQDHPAEVSAMTNGIREVSASVETLTERVDNLNPGDENIIEEINVNGEALDVVDKSVNIILSGYATTEFVESALTEYAKEEDVDEKLGALSGSVINIVSSSLTEYAKTTEVETLLSGYATTEFVESSLTEYVKATDVESALTDYATTDYVDNAVSGFATTADIEEALSDYATSADTVRAIAEAASSPSETANNYTAAKAIASNDNIGQIINVLYEEQDGSGTTYSAGLYVVTGAGEVAKLGTASASGDLAGDVENLKGRVGTIESTLESALYWEDPDELEY